MPKTLMQSQKLAVITTISALLLVISAVSTLTPQGASAYEKNQATSQTSACGNEFMPVNIGCQNTDSQIQGDENAAALTAQQTFPAVELVQEKPTPKPTPEPTPMTATLHVCKDAASTHNEGGPVEYVFIITNENPSPEQFSLMPSECQDVTVVAGGYLVTEDISGYLEPPTVDVSGDCAHMIGTTTAGGNIQAGDTQSCIFLNIEEEPVPQTYEECFTEFLTETELQEFVNRIVDIDSIAELCEFLEAHPSTIVINIDTIERVLGENGVDGEIQQVVECLEKVFGLQTESEPIES